MIAALESRVRSDGIDDPELAALWHQMERLYDQLGPLVQVTEKMLRSARLSA